MNMNYKRQNNIVEDHLVINNYPLPIRIAWTNYVFEIYKNTLSNEQQKYYLEDLYEQYIVPIYRCYIDYCELAPSIIEEELKRKYLTSIETELERIILLYQERLLNLLGNDSILIQNTPYYKAKVLSNKIEPSTEVYIPLQNNKDPNMEIVEIDNEQYISDKYLYNTNKFIK